MPFHWRAFAVGCALLCIAAECGAQLSERPAVGRHLTMAILPLENRTGDAALQHWSNIEYLLVHSFRGFPALRLRPRDEINRLVRQRERTHPGAIDASFAKLMGERLEARRVVFGYYTRTGSMWTISVRLLKTSDGKASKEISAVSTNWFDLRDTLVDGILREVGMVPSSEEKEKIRHRFTSEQAALEGVISAVYLNREQRPFSEWIVPLRKAIAADPRCADAYLGMAAALGSTGDFGAARTNVMRALELAPDDARGHQILGIVLMQEEETRDEAMSELRLARRLDPYDPTTLARMGELYDLQDQWPLAAHYFNEARQLAPTSAERHAQLARVYAKLGNRTNALAMLAEAERLADDDNANAEQLLAMAWNELREVSRALDHCRKFIMLAERTGLSPAGTKVFRERERVLSSKLTLTYVSARQPRDYTDDELNRAVRAKLSAEESLRVTNSLASTPEMRQWAREIVGQVTNDLDKARALFDFISRRLDAGDGGSRTAAEVFQQWNQLRVAFRCQEYTRLFVVLARAVGLKSYAVFVSKDTSGDEVLHECAGVFIDGQTLLVDTRYGWFGAPHQRFEFLDDLEENALHLTQLDDVDLSRIAAKLAPEKAVILCACAGVFMNEGEVAEVKKILPVLSRRDPNGWCSAVLEAGVAAREGRGEEALRVLQKTAESYPQETHVRRVMGMVLEALHRHEEAREQLRLALRYAVDEESKQQLRSGIAELTEKLDGK